MPTKTISIATSCYNEIGNIRAFYDRCRAAIAAVPGDYDYEFVVADNLSTDGTREELRRIAAEDPKFKVILNANNFGHIRSPFNALLNTSGDLVFYLCSDLQEPPELLGEFLKKYDEGCLVVCGVRSGTRAGFLMEQLRRLYYNVLGKLAPGETVIPRFTGFGLYDRRFIAALRQYRDPYPYFRGLVSEIGFRRGEVEFIQDKRRHGVTKNNFFTLYDMAMTGLVNHTRLPLRLATFTGALVALGCLIVALVYLVLKLIRWETFSLGLAPLVIGMFFLGAVQLLFIGVIGEYLGAVWLQVKNRPLVIEEERINFHDDVRSDRNS